MKSIIKIILILIISSKTIIAGNNFTNNSNIGVLTDKDTITINELLNITVKYFDITSYDDVRGFNGKICMGQNLISNTEIVRNKELEDFCFFAVLDDLQKLNNHKKFMIMDEFKKGLVILKTVNFGIDEREKLLRAQGAMFMYMRNNDVLAKLLRYSYKKKRKSLNFILKE